MTVLSILIYFGVLTQNTDLQNISFSENIDYCTNIMYNPNMQDEFNKYCEGKQTNKYIMLVKSHKLD